MAKLIKAPKTKKAVNVLLYEVDVKDLKRRSSESGIPYQVILRNLVHDALQTEGKIR